MNDPFTQGSDEGLWRRHLYLGIVSFVAGGMFLLVYVAITPHGPHREAILWVDLAAMVGSVLVIGPVGTRSLSTPWRDTFFFCWSAATVVVIAIGLSLDGGAGSPIAGLLVLPVLFGGLLYNLRDSIGLAVLALLLFFVIFVAGPPVSGGRVLATGVMVAVAGAISATAAANRSLAEQERKALTDRLHRLATYDGLTGCLNYQAFQEALSSESTQAERYGRAFTVVIADLDGFKTINDHHGHAVGDVTLTTLAAEMLQGVRSVDKVGRIGGDEFAVLLPETSSDEAEVLVERIRSRTLAAVTPERVTVSFGVSTWSGHGDSASELLRRADAALYEAKRRGRNRIAVWSDSCVPPHP